MARASRALRGPDGIRVDDDRSGGVEAALPGAILRCDPAGGFVTFADVPGFG